MTSAVARALRSSDVRDERRLRLSRSISPEPFKPLLSDSFVTGGGGGRCIELYILTSTAFFVDCMLLIFHTCIAFNSYSSLLAVMLVGVNVQHAIVNTDSIFSTSYITFIYRRCIYSSARGVEISISASFFI